MSTLKLTIPDMMLLLGIAQCTYIIVYLFFRSGRISRGSLPLLYFATLAGAFTISFLHSTLPELFEKQIILEWALWNVQTPLSTLLIIQISQIYKLPSWKHYWVLLLLPAAYLITYNLAKGDGEQWHTWLTLAGLLAGAISLLSIWMNRAMLVTPDARKELIKSVTG